MDLGASLFPIGALQETARHCTLMGHQATVVGQWVTINTLRLAIVVKYDALVPVFLIVLATVVRPVLDERILLSILVVLGAVSREVQLHILAVIIIERVRVVLRASRLRRVQHAQVHGVLRGKVDIVSVISVLAALDGCRGVGTIPLKEISVRIGRFQFNGVMTYVNGCVGRFPTLLKISKVIGRKGRGEAQEEDGGGCQCELHCCGWTIGVEKDCWRIEVELLMLR